MAKKCITQVNIPSVDNESLDCDEITTSKCVIVEKLCPKIGNIEGETLDKFIERLCIKITTMDSKIYLLIQEVEALKAIINPPEPTDP